MCSVVFRAKRALVQAIASARQIFRLTPCLWIYRSPCWRPGPDGRSYMKRASWWRKVKFSAPFMSRHSSVVRFAADRKLMVRVSNSVPSAKISAAALIPGPRENFVPTQWPWHWFCCPLNPRPKTAHNLLTIPQIPPLQRITYNLSQYMSCIVLKALNGDFGRLKTE